MGEPPTLSRASGWPQRLLGYTFGVYLVLSTLFGSLYLFVPFTPLIFFSPLNWRRLADWLNGAWHTMAGGIVRFLFGQRTRVIGDRIHSDETAIYIMNHRTSLDWFFFWNALYQQDPRLNYSEKIALKGITKHFPGSGWAMQCNSFIFLDRNFEKDKEKIQKILDYYAEVGNNYQLLLFPEGTDRCPISVESNERFCAKKGLTPYEYVLHPRTTGFVYMVQQMRKSGKIKAIYDVTVGFKDAIVQSELDIILEGLCPTDVHFQVVRIPIDQLPDKDEQLVEWLEQRWSQKEDKLRRFYDLPREQTFENTVQGKEYELTPSAELHLTCVVGAWVAATIAWTVGLLPYPMLSWFSVYGILFFLSVSAIYGGTEFLAIERFRVWRESDMMKPIFVPAICRRAAAKLRFSLF